MILTMPLFYSKIIYTQMEFGDSLCRQRPYSIFGVNYDIEQLFGRYSICTNK